MALSQCQMLYHSENRSAILGNMNDTSNNLINQVHSNSNSCINKIKYQSLKET